MQGKRRDKLKLVHLQPAGKDPEGVCSQQSFVSSLAWYRSCETACIAALTWNAGGHTVCCLCESLQVQRHGSCAILCKGRYVCYNYKVSGSCPPSLSSLPSVPTAGPVPGELSVVVAYSVASGAGVLQMFLRMPQTGGALLRLWDLWGSKELHTSFAGTFARHGVKHKLPLTLHPVPMHYCTPHSTLSHMNAVSAELPVLWRSAKATFTRRSEQNLCTQGCSVSYSIFRL